MSRNRFDDLTDYPVVVARVRRGKRVEVNQALADALGVTVRHRHIQFRNGEEGPSLRELDRYTQELGAGCIAEMGRVLTQNSPIMYDGLAGLVDFPLPVQATVVESRLECQRADVVRTTVALEFPLPLTAGDELSVDGQPGFFVSRVREDLNAEPMLYLPDRAIASAKIQRILPSARLCLERRTQHRYSLVSLQPCQGQTIRKSQLHWLASRGLRGLFHDFLRAKSSDPVPRETIQAELARIGVPIEDVEAGEGQPTFGSWEWRSALFRVNGLQLETSPGRRGLMLRYQSPDRDVSSWSSGQVTNPETIHYRTFQPTPGGLFCPQIFGPINYREGRAMDYKGGPVNERRIRWGHLELAAPVIPRFLRPYVRQALRISDKALNELLSGNPRDLLKAAAAASHPLLDKQGIKVSDLIWQTFPVMPPELRPIVHVGDGQFATSDLNDLYRRLINRNNRLSVLEQLKTPAVILHNERSMLRKAVDALAGYGAVRSGSQNRRLAAAFPILQRELREISVTQDYSAAARLIVDRAVPVNQVQVSELILEKWFTSVPSPPHDCPILISSRGYEGFLAAYPISTPDPVIRLSPRRAVQLQASDGDMLSVFLPLSRSAVAEAKRLASSGPPKSFDLPTSWLEEAAMEGTTGKFAALLMKAALKGRVDTCAALLPAVWSGELMRLIADFR